ncbi:hypothetical protein SCHPADRAFT_74014 [Schizopora paradoxa]|uniref:Uncharacterized protein n=1 Tax=Schizopora paradoxa TaxID=27342 RepID=A0A0H2S579_9AGAM|nr:hypothetical protein SCHPADRAFT_74014 [Schizopora paradoxa]
MLEKLITLSLLFATAPVQAENHSQITDSRIPCVGEGDLESSPRCVKRPIAQNIVISSGPAYFQNPFQQTNHPPELYRLSEIDACQPCKVYPSFRTSRGNEVAILTLSVIIRIPSEIRPRLLRYPAPSKAVRGVIITISSRPSPAKLTPAPNRTLRRRTSNYYNVLTRIPNQGNLSRPQTLAINLTEVTLTYSHLPTRREFHFPVLCNHLRNINAVLHAYVSGWICHVPFAVSLRR